MAIKWPQVRFIPQAQRVCARCRKRVLSGTLTIERGYLKRFVCQACEPRDLELRGYRRS